MPESDGPSPPLTRRELLGSLSATLALPLPLGLGGCGLPTRATGSFAQEGVLVGRFDSDGETAVRSALAELDLNWLVPGDSVFVKLASNSGNVHPATTAPAAVRGLVGALFDAGAGRVVVGDQGGVEAVRLAPGDARFGSTRALMTQNGLLAAIEDSGATPEFFDERTYDDGYFAGTLPADTWWTEPMMLAKVIREVDHVVYLPRLSSHVLAGYTHGLKLGVGWLRDDSRYDFHHHAEHFHEKYVDVNYCAELADRLRLTLTLAESILLHDGPDHGTVLDLDQPLVIASPHLANHDAVTVALLAHYNDVTDRDGDSEGTPYGRLASVWNRAFVSLVEGWTGLPWGDGVGPYEGYTPHRFARGVDQDRALRRAYELEGGVPESIPVALAGNALPADVLASLQAWSAGQLATG